MSRFLRPSMQGDQTVFCNYAVRDPAACDLSLVTGPFIWQEEFQRALSHAGTQLIHSYALLNENPDLLAAIAEYDGVDVSSIMLASGADSALETIMSRYLESGDTFGILSPNFPRFAIFAATIPGLEVSVFRDLADVPENAKMVSVCTPNNPSTLELPEADLRRAITDNPDVLFCVDGVFDWYGSYNLSALCCDFDNVLVLKSFSKIGLAGLRLGYVLGNKDLISDLKVGTTPFSVPALVQGIGLEIARNFGRLQEIKDKTEEQFSFIAAALGDKVVRHSPVPFYLLRTPNGSNATAALLAEAGIAVVDCAHCPEIPDEFLRVSIGTEEQNRLLVKTVNKLGI